MKTPARPAAIPPPHVSKEPLIEIQPDKLFRASKNKGAHFRAPLCMAEWTGLEPATPGVTGRYSNQLNYHSDTGGCCRDRTCDPRLVRAMLYQLS
jgi:hypothetical protein